MIKRLLRWFFFNLLFALIPLVVVLLLRWLAGRLTVRAMEENLSEILFFALMVSVTAAGDVVEVYRFMTKDSLVYALMMFFMLGAVFSSVLYGFFHFDLMIGTGISAFRPRLLILSSSMAAILFVVGTITQVFLGRVVELKEEK